MIGGLAFLLNTVFQNTEMGGILYTSERRRNDVRYLTLLSNVRLLFSNVRYLTPFRRLSDVYKIPPIGSN